VLETCWTIEDTEPYRAGAAGIEILAGPEPALVSQAVFSGPGADSIRFAPAGGAPQPAGTPGTWSFEMESLSPAPHPATEDSILQQPRIEWSTWADWNLLADAIDQQLGQAGVLDDDLRESLNETLENARSPVEKARLIAEFIDQSTRLIHLDGDWWPAPRPAARTWATGYGHRIDRAVAAAALFSEAGFTVNPAWRSHGYGEGVAQVPQLDWSEGIVLLVTGHGVDRWFDPAGARLHGETHGHTGRTVWYPAKGLPPGHQTALHPDRMEARFDLAFDAEKKAWAGTGVLVTEGNFSLHHGMVGLGTEGRDTLNAFIGRILGGATVTSWNPERFDPKGITAGFSIELPAGDRDELGRLSVELAPPPANHFVSLHQETRESDIHLPAAAILSYELHLDPGGLETVHLPAAEVLENGAGSWHLEIRETDDEVVLVRRLEVPRTMFAAAEWPELRALLLAADNRAGRLLFCK
jgi:hypothetical protein